MALEAGLLQQLADSDEGTTRVLGKWDYLSHQVIASPFKPIDYMDKMDIFGYAFIEGFRPTRERYLVCELKADKAREEDVDQLLKYVDWVKDEYSLGDYSTIQAKLVAHDFEAGLSQYVWEYARRYYTVGRRPAETRRWGDLRLVRYSYRPDDGRIDLEEMRGPTVREASLTLL